MRSSRRLRSWMVKQVSSGKYPGLVWDDKAKTMFRIPWKHGGKQNFRSDEDGAIFKAWAEFKGKVKGRNDPASWKTRLRCALNKSPEFNEVPERSQLDISEPYKVYRLVPISEQGVVVPEKKSKTVGRQKSRSSGSEGEGVVQVKQMKEVPSQLCDEDILLGNEFTGIQKGEPAQQRVTMQAEGRVVAPEKKSETAGRQKRRISWSGSEDEDVVQVKQMKEEEVLSQLASESETVGRQKRRISWSGSEGEDVFQVKQMKEEEVPSQLCDEDILLGNEFTGIQKGEPTQQSVTMQAEGRVVAPEKQSETAGRQKRSISWSGSEDEDVVQVKQMKEEEVPSQLASESETVGRQKRRISWSGSEGEDVFQVKQMKEEEVLSQLSVEDILLGTDYTVIRIGEPAQQSVTMQAEGRVVVPEKKSKTVGRQKRRSSGSEGDGVSEVPSQLSVEDILLGNEYTVIRIGEPAQQSVTMQAEGMVDEIQLDVRIKTVSPPPGAQDSFHVAIHYLGQEVLKQEVMGSDIWITYLPRFSVPPTPVSLIGGFPRISLPEPPSSLAPSAELQALSTLLPYIEKGVALTSTPLGIYGTRFCQSRVFWTGPHTAMPGLHKMERNTEPVLLFSKDAFKQRLDHFRVNGGEPPQCGITLCFGEELSNMDDPSSKLIIAQITLPWAQQLVQDT